MSLSFSSGDLAALEKARSEFYVWNGLTRQFQPWDKGRGSWMLAVVKLIKLQLVINIIRGLGRINLSRKYNQNGLCVN